MFKYSEEFKRAIIQEYLSSSDGFKVLGNRHGVHPSLIQKWINRHRHYGDAGLVSRGFNRFSPQFKLSVLERMWRESLSYSRAAIVCNVANGATISRWEKRYRENGLEGLAPPDHSKKGTMSKYTEPPCGPRTGEARTLEDLRRENEYLRAEVAYLKKLDALVRANQQAAQKKRKP